MDKLKVGDIVETNETQPRYGFIAKIENKQVRPVYVIFFGGDSTYVNVDGSGVTYAVKPCARGNELYRLHVGASKDKTLRDEFAMAAMGVFIQGGYELMKNELAELAYEIADAMLKEREK